MTIPPHMAYALSLIGVVAPATKPAAVTYPAPWKPAKPGDEPPF